MTRFFVTFLISVMVVCFFFIYLVTPKDMQPMVGIVSVIISALAMIVGYGGGPSRQVEVLKPLSAFTALLTVFASALVGRELFGSAGAFCLPVGLMLVVAGGFFLYLRRAVVVEEGDVMVIDRLIGGDNYALGEGIYRPMMTGIEEAVAMLPAYELTTTVEVKEPDTHLLFRPDSLTIFLRYRIRELTIAERMELEDEFDREVARARSKNISRDDLIERLSTPPLRIEPSTLKITRTPLEHEQLGKELPMSAEELADRRQHAYEAAMEQAEARAEAWQLFVNPMASYLRLVYRFPNRDCVLNDQAEHWSEPLEEVRLRSEFWTELIRHQITEELDEVARETVHDARGFGLDRGRPVINDEGVPAWNYYGPVEISERREALSTVIWRRLQRRVRRWGIQVLDLHIEQVTLNASSINFRYKPMFERQKTQEAHEEAKREADRIKITSEAQADALVHLVDRLADELRDEAGDLSEDDIRRIIFQVLEEQKRLEYRLSPTKTPAPTPKPSS